jgi:hypothetical protein
MAALTYTFGDHLVRLDDDTIECFALLVLGSFRAPLTWAAVALLPTKKGDDLHVRVGNASQPGGPFYDENTIFQGAWSFDVPAGEESALRSFFDEAARRGGRPG